MNRLDDLKKTNQKLFNKLTETVEDIKELNIQNGLLTQNKHLYLEFTACLGFWKTSIENLMECVKDLKEYLLQEWELTGILSHIGLLLDFYNETSSKMKKSLSNDGFYENKVPQWFIAEMEQDVKRTESITTIIFMYRDAYE